MGKDLLGNELGVGITQRKDGVYYGRVKVNGVTSAVYGKNLMEVRVKLAEAKANANTPAFNFDMTVAEWFDKWFDVYKAPVVKKTSVGPMKNRVKSTFLPYIGKKKVTELTNYEFQSALTDLLASGTYARGSIKEAANRMEECFAAAVNNGYIHVNPAYGCAVPLDNKDVEERRFLSKDEIKLFLQTAKENYSWWYEMLYFMIHTGLRIGEVSALCWSDIDWKNRCIKVRRNLAVWYENGVKHETLTTPKTQNAYRTIPFMGEVEAVLRAQKEKVDALKVSLGDRYRSKGEFGDLVFVTTMGSVCGRYNAEKIINKIVIQINLEESIRARAEKREPVMFERVYPHALRHTFASICFHADMNIKVVQRLMGHANYATTLNVYTHIMGDKLSDDVEKFNEMLKAI